MWQVKVAVYSLPDADGVLFAALQGLNQKLEAELQSKDARIANLE